MIKHNSKKVNRFWLGNIRKEVQSALEKVKQTINTNFPKNSDRWLSQYEYLPMKIHFEKDGSVRGGAIRLLFTLIDFSFIRDLVADCYSNEGGNCYDPVTMFLLEVMKLWDKYTYYGEFNEDIRDIVKGKQYRKYVGIKDRIPDEVDMHNFRKRIGEEKLQEVLGLLVELFKIIGIITGQVLSTDGTLIEAFARFRGCNYMEDCCKYMFCPDDIFKELNNKIQDTINTIEKEDKISKILSVDMQCPMPEVIDKMKEALKNKKKEIPLSDIGAFSILKIKISRNPVDGWQSHLKYLNEDLGLNINIKEGYGIEIITCSASVDEKGNMKYHCPKASKDITARTGYRRNKEKPNKIEPVFGYKAVIMTSIEVELELELPIMVQTGAGNIDEARTFIEIHKKLSKYASFKTEYNIMDSGYDYEYVYEYVRGQESIPIIDYNYRNEKLTKEALLKRGYDELGRPYAPCGKVCKSNGPDYKRKTIKYICGKRHENCKSCEHGDKKYGYSKSVPIKDNPRLNLEVPRSSKRYKKIKAIRSSSERTNSYGKQWSGLSNLRLYGTVSYAVRAIIVCITILLKKISQFIAKMTLYHKDYALAVKLYGPVDEKKFKACA